MFFFLWISSFFDLVTLFIVGKRGKCFIPIRKKVTNGLSCPVDLHFSNKLTGNLESMNNSREFDFSKRQTFTKKAFSTVVFNTTTNNTTRYYYQYSSYVFTSTTLTIDSLCCRIERNKIKCLKFSRKIGSYCWVRKGDFVEGRLKVLARLNCINEIASNVNLTKFLRKIVFKFVFQVKLCLEA